MAQYDEEAWRRVGRYLRYRRAQLDPDYQQRSAWIRAVQRPGFSGRVITDLELGERDNYAKDTLRIAEDVYQLKPGSIRHAVEEGGDPQPLDEPAGAPGAAADGTTEPYADSELAMTRGFRRIASLVAADTAPLSEIEAAALTGRLMDTLVRNTELFLYEERVLRQSRRQRPEDG